MKDLFFAFLKAAKILVCTAFLWPLSWLLARILGQTPKTAQEIAAARFGWVKQS